MSINYSTKASYLLISDTTIEILNFNLLTKLLSSEIVDFSYSNYYECYCINDKGTIFTFYNTGQIDKITDYNLESVDYWECFKKSLSTYKTFSEFLTIIEYCQRKLKIEKLLKV